jgi:hypothetical protein
VNRTLTSVLQTIIVCSVNTVATIFSVTELKEDAGGKAVFYGSSSVVDTHHRIS